jgi:hypothetical protein
MRSALAFASSAATASYTLAPSRTFAFRQDLRAYHVQSPRLAAPLFSYSPAPIREGYELLFPPARRTLGGQTLCFDNHPHSPGVWGSTASGFLRALCAVAFPGLVGAASPFFSYYCKLFCSLKKVNSFAIKQIQTLFRKHPGVGYVNIQAPRRATWTRRTHPIINATSLRCQVHG